MSYVQIGQKLRSSLFQSGINPEPFSTQRLHHGGALHSYLCGESAEQIAVKGRWTAFKSLQRYLTSGYSKLMQMDIGCESMQATAEAEERANLLVQACKSVTKRK